MALLQLLEHRPEQGLGPFRVALPIGVRKRVLAGRGRPTNRRQRPRVQPERIAHVIETQGVGELRIDQADHMTPGQEGAALFLDGMRAGQVRHQMIGNKIAELPQARKLSPRWLALRSFFPPPPCGRGQTRKPTLFQTSTFKPV